jgi:hypothetical protein
MSAHILCCSHLCLPSPISVLPADLPERIMFAALEIPNRGDERFYHGPPLLIECHPAPYYATSRHAGPWLFRNVCYQWRTLVESSPRMWSHIFIKDCHSNSRHTETLKTFISYSGSSSHHILAYVQHIAPGLSLEYESFRILAAGSSRWRSARIHLSNFERHASLELLRPLIGNLPRLHTLKLSLTLFNWSLTVPSAADLCSSLAGPNNPFTSLPSLRYLDLSGVYVSQQPTDNPDAQGKVVPQEWPMEDEHNAPKEVT